MKFKTSADAVKYLSNMGLSPNWPVLGGVMRGTMPGQSFEVVGTRIWYEVESQCGWLDENYALCKEIEDSFCD